MSREKVYFSSKELYFLPKINSLKTHPNRPSILIDHSSHRLRSIQQVFADKTIAKIDKSQLNKSICKERKKIHQKHNLYDQYEQLPKIMAKKYRKCSNRNQADQTNENIQKQQKKSKQDKRGERTTTTEASSFDFSFYKQHYQNKLCDKVAQIPLCINGYPQTPNMLMSKSIQQEAAEQTPTVKYTKLHITEPSMQQSELERVPQFLIKLLQQHRVD